MIKFWSIGYVTLLLYIVAFKIDNRSISYSSITYLRNYGTVELSLLKLKSSTLDKIKKCIGCCCCCFRRCHDSCGNSNDDDDDFDNNIDHIYGQGNPPTDRVPIPVRREGHPKTLLERYNQRLQSKTGSGYRSVIWSLNMSLQTINEDEDENEEDYDDGNCGGIDNPAFESDGDESKGRKNIRNGRGDKNKGGKKSKKKKHGGGGGVLQAFD